MTTSDSTGPKIRGKCKQRAIIFYEDRVIPLWNLHGCNAKFCNFWMVPMPTGVDRGKFK